MGVSPLCDASGACARAESRQRILFCVDTGKPRANYERSASGRPTSVLAHLFRHRDVVMSLADSLADDHLENERVGLGGAPDLDHINLLGGQFFGEPQSKLRK